MIVYYLNQSNYIHMNNQKLFTALLLVCISVFGYAQEDDDEYLVFNDRNNVVHGVYLGLNFALGEINDKDSYMGGLKVAYVANQKFEVGFAGNFIYSEQNVFNRQNGFNED